MASDSHTRRGLLATGAFCVATWLSGCSALRPNGIQLGAVAVTNQSSDPHDITVRVERDERLVHESTVSLGSETGEDFALVECTWDSTARGVFRFESELADTGETNVTTSHHLEQGRCYVADIICLRGTLTSAWEECAEVEGHPAPLCYE